MNIQDEVSKILENASNSSKVYIDSLRSKLEWALFSQMLTAPEKDKQVLADLMCLFCLSAYQSGQVDSLKAVNEAFKDYISDIKITTSEV